MNIFLLISSVFATQVNFETFDPEYIGEFTKGFFSGVTNGNAKCTSAAGNTANSFYTLVEDIKNYNNNYVQILTDFSVILKASSSIQLDCNVPALITQIHKIMGPAGKGILMRNYMMNSKQITTDMAVIEQCSVDFFNCGKSVGEIFRLVTGYNVKLSETVETPEEVSEGKDLIHLVQGFVSVAEFGTTENCKEMFEGFSDFSKVRSDVYGALKAPIEEQVKLVQYVLGMWFQDEDFNDCALQYGGMVFYAIPYLLSSTPNWQRAFEFEPETINHLFNQLVTLCPKDYHACGSKLGTLFNTIASYA
jgi:hypothetical protein